jgi:hypothetical protein
MQPQVVLLTLPLFVATVVALGLAGFIWRRREAPGAIPVALVLLGAAEWSLLYALSIAATDLDQKLLFEQLALPGRLVVPVAWFIFAVEFVRQVH